jgi:MtN3 and saliva related transmembrane protein
LRGRLRTCYRVRLLGTSCGNEVFDLKTVEVIGYVAAGCTTLSFIPQILKIRRHGGASLSYLMLSIYLVGLGLWLIYGIMLHANAIIVANAASVLLVATAIIMKAIVET